MLDLNYIRNHKEEILVGLDKRNFEAPQLLEDIIALDQQRRSQQTELDTLLAQANSLAKEIGNLFKTGQAEKATPLKEQSTTLKNQTKTLQEALQKTNAELLELRTRIPNVPHTSVVKGNSEEDNEVVAQHGTIPKLDENALPHWELAAKYDLIDFELGNKITGAGFPVYKGKGARLQRALIQFFLDENTAAGYQEMQVPHVVNAASGFGTGQLPDKEGQMYHITGDDLYLIPTAEVPLTNIYRDTLMQEDELPVALSGYTPCFRREAGSYGAHVRGLNRLHQFDKVEIVRIEKPENGIKALDEMVAHVQQLLSKLELPYRILRLCGGDLGFTAALTYDFEVYSTAQERWLEISSVSVFNTFQAERLQLRYKTKSGEKIVPYTLNGSALALPRILAGLLENFQTPQGIKIPKALHPYTGFTHIEL